MIEDQASLSMDTTAPTPVCKYVYPYKYEGGVVCGLPESQHCGYSLPDCVEAHGKEVYEDIYHPVPDCHLVHHTFHRRSRREAMVQSSEEAKHGE